MTVERSLLGLLQGEHAVLIQVGRLEAGLCQLQHLALFNLAILVEIRPDQISHLG